MNVKWRPEGALAGDTIPYYWEGKYHVFYLVASESSDPALRFYADWGHVVSSDLVHWEELPAALKPGPKGSPDGSGVWTGSVIEREGTFHIFYTVSGSPEGGGQVSQTPGHFVIHICP